MPSKCRAALGHLRFEQQKWSEAERHYAKVAEQEPKHPTAHYNLGLCLERQSKFEEAAKEFEAALAIDPKRWQAQMGRGLCLLRLNQAGSGAAVLGGGAERTADFEKTAASG